MRQIQAQNDQLQNKLLSLAGDAADRYHRLRMSEMVTQASVHPSGGMIPADGLEEDSVIDNMMAQMFKGQ